MMAPIKVAVIHDWLTGMRGGEYVLEAIVEMFPECELFTLIYSPGRLSPSITIPKRHTSILQKLPGIQKRYRYFLPVMPNLIERFDLSGFDLIISSSHCVAKGIKKPPGAVHVSYVHAPMRYFWDRYEDYFGVGRASMPVRLAARFLRGFFQNWDRGTSTVDRIDSMVANSQYIAGQIYKAYGREARVVYPFANPTRFTKIRQPGRNYLIVGAFAPYKRLDLAIEACNRLMLPLIIVGGGQEQRKLKQMAGPTVEFLGTLSNAAIADLYSKCRAFVFPGLEDFGITPIEAMAAGAPVIAYGEGGALETVTNRTGLFFKPQTVEALVEALLNMEKEPGQFLEMECRNRASEFTRERFQSEFAQIILETWAQKGKNTADLLAAFDETLGFNFLK